MNEPSAAPATPIDAPVRRKGGILRKLVKLVVVLLLLVALSPLALKLGFVRDFVASRASKALGVPVTMAGASAWWTSGIDVEGLVVGSPPGHDGPLARVDKVHLEVGLLGLLRGDVQASVTVTRPTVMLRRNAAGAWNLNDLVDQQPASEPKPASAGGAKPGVRLEVIDGAVEAHGLSGRVERISDIDLTTELQPSGAVKATLGAIAEKASLAGGDVRISISGAKTPSGDQPVSASVPELDLKRLAGLIEGFTGLKDIEGTTNLEAAGSVAPDGSVKGQVVLGGQRFRATTAGGARVSLGSVRGTIDVTQGPDGDSAKADVTLSGVELVSGPEADAVRLTEPEVTARFEATRAKDESILVPVLQVAAGQALSLKAAAPIAVSAPKDGARRVEGKATLTADLARLAALKTFVPSLASLTSGLVVASFEGRSAEGLDVGLGARVSNLRLAPGDLAADGYEERDITLQARLARAADGSLRIDVYGLTSTLARLAAAQPFQVTRSADGALAFAGPLDLSVDLEALSRLAGAKLGLAKGERLRGTFGAKGQATGSPEDGRLDLTLAGRQLAFPASWSANTSPAALDGLLSLQWSKSLFVAELKGLKGVGVTADGRGAMKRNPDGMLFDAAEATLSADLAQVRAWFGSKLGLTPETALSGALKSDVRVQSTATGRRVSGTTQVANLSYRATRDAAPLEEQALTLEQTLVLPREEGAAMLLEVLKLRGGGLQVDLSGSSLGSGPKGALALKGTLEGDAARLAERVRAFMGPEYKDLTGSGQVTGTFTLNGSGESMLEGSTADATLALGTWKAAGATVESARATLRRASTRQPYALDLTTTVNGGPTSASLTLMPAGKALAWTLKALMKDVDLSTLLVDHGAGKYLGYVLPTLVPVDQSTPVLSGKLEADLDLKAADFAPETLKPTLAGRGRVSLTQGTLGQSTLFGAIGGGQGLGDVGKALQQVVPEVGRELGNLQRSLAFQSVLSRFSIANQVVTVEETKLSAQSVRIDMTGTVTFEQQANLALRLWMGGMGGEALKRVLPDQTIPLKVRGKLDKPQVLPDLKASDLLKGALPALLPKPTDLLPGAGADPKKALEDEAKKLKDRLKGLFPK